MINVGDVGKDYEHGVQLVKKLNEFRGAAEGVRNSSRGLCAASYVQKRLLRFRLFKRSIVNE